VNVWSTNRRTLSWFTFVFLGLGLAVVSWGLQYKLSLYDPPNAASHSMPEAKLLSKSEQTTAPENPLLSSTNISGKILCTILASVFFLFLLADGSLNAPASDQRPREERRPWHFRRLPGLNAFYFRPPPSVA
jgi:hypothetical protein